MTKKEYFEAIKDIVKQSNVDNKNELIYFLDNQITAILNKSEKAKQKALERKVQPDELKNEIKNLLTKDFLTIEDIMAKMTHSVSKAKMVARLTQLINEKEVIKDTIKNNSNKLRTVYKLK